MTRRAGTRRDVTARAIAAAGVFATLGIVIGLLLSLWWLAVPAISWDLLRNGPSRDAGRAGMWPALMGSVWLVSGAMCLAVPLGVGTAVYLEEYASRSRWTRLVDFNIATLAAMPSVVFGLLGLGLFVRTLGLGRSVLAGAMTLALCALPQIVFATRNALRTVPAHVRDASYALGATRGQTLWRQVIPMARPRLVSGLLVAVARTSGEAAPLLVIGALTFVPVAAPTADAPFTAVPLQIFHWLQRAQPDFVHTAAAAGLFLVIALLAVNAAAVWLRARTPHGRSS